MIRIVEGYHDYSESKKWLNKMDQSKARKIKLEYNRLNNLTKELEPLKNVSENLKHIKWGVDDLKLDFEMLIDVFINKGDHDPELLVTDYRTKSILNHIDRLNGLLNKESNNQEIVDSIKKEILKIKNLLDSKILVFTQKEIAILKTANSAWISTCKDDSRTSSVSHLDSIEHEIYNFALGIVDQINDYYNYPDTISTSIITDMIKTEARGAEMDYMYENYQYCRWCTKIVVNMLMAENG